MDELILLVREVLQIRVWWRSDTHPPYSPDLVAAGNSHVPKVKTAPKRKKVSGHQGHLGEHNCGIKYNSS